MLVFEESGKAEYPGKNLPVQSREPTNLTHVMPSLGIKPGPHWWEASALTSAPSLHPQVTLANARCFYSLIGGALGVNVLKWYYDQKIISFFSSDFERVFT